MRLNQKDILRFLDKILVDEHGCWVWQASTRNGYAAFSVRSKQYKASRVSYLMFKGDPTKDFHVYHTCDNKLCVSPKHLWLGTQSENIQDYVDKNRHVGRTGQFKLFDDAIRSIRILHSRGISQRRLAKIYGVSNATICRNLKHRGA
jgi:hypothetical protein